MRRSCTRSSRAVGSSMSRRSTTCAFYSCASPRIREPPSVRSPRAAGPRPSAPRRCLIPRVPDIAEPANLRSGRRRCQGRASSKTYAKGLAVTCRLDRRKYGTSSRRPRLRQSTCSRSAFMASGTTSFARKADPARLDQLVVLQRVTRPNRAPRRFPVHVIA